MARSFLRLLFKNVISFRLNSITEHDCKVGDVCYEPLGIHLYCQNMTESNEQKQQKQQKRKRNNNGTSYTTFLQDIFT